MSCTGFFERMIDDQLSAEFGAAPLSNLTLNANSFPAPNPATPNAASQMPVTTNHNGNFCVGRISI